MIDLYKSEMARTAPPEKCQACERDGNCQSQPNFQDNRHELYRLFALMPSDIPGVEVYVCKKCLLTAYSREGLYDIYNSDTGKTRRSYVTESVVCRAGCGRSWRWKQAEVIKIPITGGA